MKILGVLTNSIGGRLTSNSMFEGFKALGHNITVFDTLAPKKPSDKSFDLVIGYDFSAIEYNVENGLALPTINYFSDEIKSPASGKKWEKFYPYLKEKGNFTFCWEKEIAEREGLIYMPHFVDCKIYKNLSLKPSYDIMFAGRLDTDLRLNMFIDLMKSFPNLSFAWFAIEKHFQDALSRSEEKSLITHVYKGFIDNEPDMATAINRSKIVININAQGVSSLNYRTLQTAACEKLLLSDYRKDLSLFDGAIPYYTDFQDLKHKIKYYLENEAEYKNLTAKAAETVRKNHNAKSAAQKMLEIVNI